MTNFRSDFFSRKERKGHQVKIADRKLDTRNLTRLQMIKDEKERMFQMNVEFVIVSASHSDLSYGLNDLNDLNRLNGSNQGSVSWRKT